MNQTAIDWATNPRIRQDLGDIAVGTIDQLTDRLWTDLGAVPDVQNPDNGDSAYQTYRAKCGQLATIAAITGHSRLPEIIGAWAALQRNRIDAVTKSLGTRRTRLDADLKEQRGEAERLQGQVREYENLLREIQTAKAGQVDHAKAIQLGALAQHAQDRSMWLGEHEQSLRAIGRLDAASEQLNGMQKLEPQQIINYLIHSAEAIEAAVKEGNYTGPTFEPFKPHSTYAPQDIVARLNDTIVPSRGTGNAFKKRDNLPPVLQYLLAIRDYSLSLGAGTTQRSGDLHQGAGLESVTANWVGSYVSKAPQLFGLKDTRKGTARGFTRTAGDTSMSEEQFLKQVRGLLAPLDSGSVNAFYIDRVLRERRNEPELYTGFTTEQFLIWASDAPLSRSIVSINFAKRRDELDIEKMQKGMWRKKKVDLSDEQLELGRAAFKEAGRNPMGVDTLVAYGSSHKLPLAPRVATTLLKHLAPEFGYQHTQGTPVVYQPIQGHEPARRLAESSDPGTPSSSF